MPAALALEESGGTRKFHKKYVGPLGLSIAADLRPQNAGEPPAAGNKLANDAHTLRNDGHAALCNIASRFWPAIMQG